MELAPADDVGGGLAAEAARQQRLEGSAATGRRLFVEADVELGSVQAQGMSQEDLCLQRRLLDARRRQVSRGAAQGLA